MRAVVSPALLILGLMNALGLRFMTLRPVWSVFRTLRADVSLTVGRLGNGSIRCFLNVGTVMKRVGMAGSALGLALLIVRPVGAKMARMGP